MSLLDRYYAQLTLIFSSANKGSVATSSCIGAATPAASEHPAEDSDDEDNLIDLSSDDEIPPGPVDRSSPQSNGPPPIPEQVDARSDDLIDLSSDNEIPLRPVDRSSPHSKGSLPNSSQVDVKSNVILITDSGKVYPLYRPPFESRATKPSNAPSRDTKTMWNDFRDKCITLINTEDSCIKKGGSQWKSHDLYGYRKTKEPFNGRTFTKEHHLWDVNTQGKCLAKDFSDVNIARTEAELSWCQFNEKDLFSSYIARGATLLKEQENPFEMNLIDERRKIDDLIKSIGDRRRSEGSGLDLDPFELAASYDQYDREEISLGQLRLKKSLFDALSTSRVLV